MYRSKDGIDEQAVSTCLDGLIVPARHVQKKRAGQKKKNEHELGWTTT